MSKIFSFFDKLVIKYVLFRSKTSIKSIDEALLTLPLIPEDYTGVKFDTLCIPEDYKGYRFDPLFVKTSWVFDASWWTATAFIIDRDSSPEKDFMVEGFGDTPEEATQECKTKIDRM